MQDSEDTETHTDEVQSTKKKIPVRTRFSAPFQTGPGAHSASCAMATGVSFPGVKWPGRGVNNSPSSVEVKERVKLYLYASSAPSWLVTGRNLPLITEWCLL